MALAELADLPRRGRMLGLDVGTKTIGVAAGDAETGIASPIETIRRTRWAADAARLLALASERRVVGFVIGLPVNMDGSEGPRCQSVRQLAVNLAALSDLPIVFWDERLSTAAVERAMIAADLSRKKRAERVDHLAAAYILEGALARLRQIPRPDLTDA